MSAGWSATINDVSLLCQITHPDDRPELTSALQDATVDGFEFWPADGSAWTRFEFRKNGVRMHGSLFVRRLVVSLVDVPVERQSLSNSLEFALSSKALLQSAARALIEALGGDAQASRSYLILNCGPLHRGTTARTDGKSAPGWLDDGMTTFSLRAFDSRRNRVGVIRVSRHLTMTFGLTNGLITDLNNLVYEQILYGSWPTGSNEVFSLLGALGDYVLPTEVSLYTHRVAQRLAAFGVLVGVVFAAILPLQDMIVDASDWRIVTLGLIMLYSGFALITSGAWIILGWIGTRFADR
jgi:hypothetical protein